MGQCFDGRRVVTLSGFERPSRWSSQIIRGKIRPRQRCISKATESGLSKGDPSPVLVLPGFLSGAESYQQFADDLKKRGYIAEVLALESSEWYPTLWGGSYEFYVEKLADAIDELHGRYGPLALVGHSAGGWIARICLGSVPYQGQVFSKNEKVKSLVTLGTPHLSLEQYPFGRIEEKVMVDEQLDLPEGIPGSSLRFTNHFYPDGKAFENVKIVSVMGKLTTGRPLSFEDRIKYLFTQGGVPDEVARKAFAHTSYKANCGVGEVLGDGVCPLETGLLPASKHILLDGVFHGPGSRTPWYGSQEVIPMWEGELC
ncbi:hypothetical protein BSKO_08364 [Bryopsis sp. KO-2023]|nr:hypothetical protein BSKO_08364 [Bryopsis sp. KO-2023]